MCIGESILCTVYQGLGSVFKKKICKALMYAVWSHSPVQEVTGSRGEYLRVVGIIVMVEYIGRLWKVGRREV